MVQPLPNRSTTRTIDTTPNNCHFFSPLFYFHAPTHNEQPFATHNERHTTQKNKFHHVCTGSMPQSSARDRERPPHLSYIKCPIQVDHTNITSRQIRLVTAPPHLRRGNINQSCHMHTKRFYSIHLFMRMSLYLLAQLLFLSRPFSLLPLRPLTYQVIYPRDASFTHRD